MVRLSGFEQSTRSPEPRLAAATPTLVELGPQHSSSPSAPRLEGITRGAGFRLETFRAREHEFILVLAGEFDLFSGRELRSELAALRLRRARRVIVDLTATAFIDASTLGLLVDALERLRAAGGDLVLVCVDSHLLKVLELTLLDRRFSIYQSRAHALAARPPASLPASA
jgi:anti-sigma B factor antagonist